MCSFHLSIKAREPGRPSCDKCLSWRENLKSTQKSLHGLVKPIETKNPSSLCPSNASVSPSFSPVGVPFMRDCCWCCLSLSGLFCCSIIVDTRVRGFMTSSVSTEPFFGVDPNILFVCLFFLSCSCFDDKVCGAHHRVWLLPPGPESWFAHFWTHLTSMQPVLNRTSVWLTCIVDRRTEHYVLQCCVKSEDICKTYVKMNQDIIHHSV